MIGALIEINAMTAKVISYNKIEMKWKQCSIQQQPIAEKLFYDSAN